MALKVVTKEEYIEYHENAIANARKKMVEEFATLSYEAMNQLILSVASHKGLVGFAKSGKMAVYSIYEK